MAILLFFIGVALPAGILNAQAEQVPQFLMHRVRQGETASSISDHYGVMKKDFLMLNNFPNNVALKPGQVVLIRELKPGEQPESIVEEKTVTKETVAERETPPPPRPRAEEKTKETPPPPAERHPVKPAPAVNGSTQVGPGGVKYAVSEDGYHVVQRGQTFYRIALIYGLTVDELKALNNLSNTNVEIGQKLRVKK
ncbi:MAG TPA: LysM peptidoglycan-binding domain-containing protein [Chitinophagales bacterium]|nr:LysM peptidoglycan-binding domain-containing protein [Chitinophagales bacterium]